MHTYVDEQLGTSTAPQTSIVHPEPPMLLSALVQKIAAEVVKGKKNSAKALLATTD